MTSNGLIEEINAAYRRLSAAMEDQARAELDLQHARREVERLHLIVRLLGTQAGGAIRG